jgi:hypothetical protein
VVHALESAWATAANGDRDMVLTAGRDANRNRGRSREDAISVDD